FSYPLGSTNPCPIAVHMEPFSTSVFKICTGARFTPPRGEGCSTSPSPSYSAKPRWAGISRSLQRHLFSGLVHSAGEESYSPAASNHSLYLIKLSAGCSYPEGNFGGNQLLDRSIRLSPLYPNLTIDLHVRIATSLHQSF
ncbi:unnamed protein product, partial [Discosporangium mesarthrocarpum]